MAKKLSKLKPAERADYEARAAAKGQSLEQYVLRRIQKKTEKNSTEAAETETASAPGLFFTDLQGDPDLVDATADRQPKEEKLSKSGEKSKKSDKSESAPKEKKQSKSDKKEKKSKKSGKKE